MPTVVARLLLALAVLIPSVASAQDYAVTWASTPPTAMNVGDIVSVSYEVENLGTVATPANTVAFGVIDAVNGYALHEEPLASLAAGGFTSGTMTFSVPTGVDGAWQVVIIADPFDMVVEVDEMNNGYVFPGMFTIGGGMTGGTINVSNDPLPQATVGTAYTTNLLQTGGTAPSWFVSSGSLPPGLQLAASGTLSGTPNTAGEYTFSVTAEQTGYTPGSATLSILVRDGGGGTFMVTPAALPQATVGVPFNETVSASGGVAPYAYTIISEVPPWLTLVGSGAEAGTLRGTPTAVGTHTLLVYVVDSASADGMGTVTLSVVEAGPLTVNTTLAAAVTGKTYAERIVVGGLPPYTTQIASGALPAGLSIDAAGRLTGVPGAQGNFTFEVAATDAGGATASGAVTVAVTELQQLTVQTTNVTVYVNADADVMLTALGGVPPYSWQMIGGTLPAGVSFDAGTATVIGHPTQIGEGTATFRVTDGEGLTAEADVPVKVSIFVAPGRSGASRRGGCVCVAASERSVGGLVVVLIAAGLLRRRRRIR